MGRQKRAEHPDPEWLELANKACRDRGRGEPLRLSRLLGVNNTTVYRSLSGAIISPEIMLRLSLELGIRPPKTVPLDPDEWRAILVATSIRRVGDRARLAKVLDVLEALTKRVSVLVALRDVAAHAARAGMTEVDGRPLPDMADVNAQIEREWDHAGFGLPLPEPTTIPFPSDADALIARVEAGVTKRKRRK